MATAAPAAAASRSLVLITGASRGFGKSLALEAARQWGPTGVDMHLIARSAPGLEATKQAVEALSGQDVRVWTWPMDLGDLDGLPAKLTGVFAQVQTTPPPSTTRYAKAYLFNNAGLVGPIAYAQDLHKDLAAVRHAVDMNVTSFVYLTSLFLQLFGGGSAAPAPASAAAAAASVVVNVSSLAAVQPFHSWGMYCAGKAARDMFTQVVGQEQTPEEGKGGVAVVKTLNYAPGPLETDMQKELRESESLHGPTREWSLEAFKEGTLVQPGDSAAKCVRILKEDRFASGAHIDYYDEV